MVLWTHCWQVDITLQDVGHVDEAELAAAWERMLMSRVWTGHDFCMR